MSTQMHTDGPVHHSLSQLLNVRSGDVGKGSHSRSTSPSSVHMSSSRIINAEECQAVRPFAMLAEAEGMWPAGSDGSMSLPVGMNVQAPQPRTSLDGSARQHRPSVSEQQPQNFSTTDTSQNSVPSRPLARNTQSTRARSPAEPKVPVLEMDRAKKRGDQPQHCSWGAPPPTVSTPAPTPKSNQSASRVSDGQKEVEQDAVQESVVKFFSQRSPTRVPFQRLSRGVYLYGNKKLVVALHNDKLMVRIGGGFFQLESYLADAAERSVSTASAVPRRQGKAMR